MLPKSLLNNYLTIAFLLAFGTAKAQTDCKDIKATIEVFQAGQKAEKASVTIDFKDQPKSLFEVSLLGPKGYSKKDIQESEVSELNTGVYTLIIVYKRKDDVCMKYFEVKIK
jgi:hypothetical protein